MKTILVATDFSTRSDRALRRAVLIARQRGASLVLIHAIDDDRQERMVTSERLAAQELLGEIASSVRREDGVACAERLAFGAADEAIVSVAVEVAADLIVVGPHRRHSISDIFVGTTVERVIRKSPIPVLMAAAPPAHPYRRAMVAVDLSANSAAAITAIRRLELAKGGSTGVIHVFDAPAQGLMLRTSTTSDQLRAYIAGERARASDALDAFLASMAIRPDFRLVELAEETTATTILDGARRKEVDLVVIGTRGRTGIGRLLLGSVAEAVLRHAQTDVLAVAMDETPPAT